MINRQQRLYRVAAFALTAAMVIAALLLLVLTHPDGWQYRAALQQVRWHLLLVVLALGAVPWLMSGLFNARRRQQFGLLHRCLLGSVLVHLLLGFLFSVWVISQEVYQAVKADPLEVAVATDALAAERLALEIREHVAELPPAPEPALAGEQSVERLPLPDVQPLAQFAQVDAPPVAPAEAFAIETKAPPAPTEQAVEKLEPAPIAPPLPPLQIAALDVKLEAAPRVQPVPTTGIDPKPDTLPGFPQESPPPAGAPQPIAPKLPSIAPPPLPLQDHLLANAPKPPKPSSKPAAPDSLVKVAPPALGSLSLVAEMKLEAKPPQPAERYALRDPKARENMIEQLGGSKETEEAIARSLEWFTRNQEPDGRWTPGRLGGTSGHDVATTSLAMLCYMGWGATHLNATPHQQPVSKALRWLTAQMKAGGDLRGNGGDMYDQGIGTIALAEAYGLTRDENLRPVIEQAITFIARAQNTDGGWRYRPAEGISDTSVVGWQVMALKSAELAGLAVPPPVLEGARRWLKFVGGGKHGGLYGYQNKEPRQAMVPEGMFCQQLFGVDPLTPMMQESAEYLKANLPKASAPDFYYWYYGCLSLYQHQGPIWEEWNKQMRALLLAAQSRSGKEAGSWDPRGPRSERAGRATITAFATLSLEVYYRYLPLYGGGVKVK